MKILISTITVIIFMISTNAVHAQTGQYLHGIGSNSSALYNSVGLTYQQCQDRISDEMQKTLSTLDRGKAVALALASPEFQARVAGHKYELAGISTNDTWDNSLCGNVKRTGVGVGFNLLDTPDTYIESVNVAEDANTSLIIQVDTSITPICRSNCPPAIPPIGSDFVPSIESAFRLAGVVVPNATVPVSVVVANSGSTTLYDVHVVFVSSPLLQDFGTGYGNFTLGPGEEKTVTGTMSLPSQISSVPSMLNWMIYANSQDGKMGSKEFLRTINLANRSSLDTGSMPIKAVPPPLKQNTPVNEIKCREGFLLIIKSEDYSPACVTPGTNQTLVGRGWGTPLSLLLEPPALKKIEIMGLQQNYEAGKKINATVRFTGYEPGGLVPDVKIIDSNGTEVWRNCCIDHSESPHWTFSTFSYAVTGPAGRPAINKTGTYAMVASLENKTAEASFAISPSLESQNSATSKQSNPLGVAALVTYSPYLSCMGECPPYAFYLKINSNETAYLLGYDICGNDFCVKNNTLAVLLPKNNLEIPNYTSIGLSENKRWSYGDTVNIRLEISPLANRDSEYVLDVKNSEIVP